MYNKKLMPLLTGIMITSLSISTGLSAIPVYADSYVYSEDEDVNMDEEENDSEDSDSETEDEDDADSESEDTSSEAEVSIIQPEPVRATSFEDTSVQTASVEYGSNEGSEAAKTFWDVSTMPINEPRMRQDKIKIDNGVNRFEIVYSAAATAPKIVFKSLQGNIFTSGQNSSKGAKFMTRTDLKITGYDSLRYEVIYIADPEDPGTWDMQISLDPKANEFIFAATEVPDNWETLTLDYKTSFKDVYIWYLDEVNSQYYASDISRILAREAPPSIVEPEAPVEPEDNTVKNIVSLVIWLVILIGLGVGGAIFWKKKKGQQADRNAWDNFVSKANEKTRRKKEAENDRLDSLLDDFGDDYDDDDEYDSFGRMENDNIEMEDEEEEEEKNNMQFNTMQTPLPGMVAPGIAAPVQPINNDMQMTAYPQNNPIPMQQNMGYNQFNQPSASPTPTGQQVIAGQAPFAGQFLQSQQMTNPINGVNEYQQVQGFNQGVQPQPFVPQSAPAMETPYSQPQQSVMPLDVNVPMQQGYIPMQGMGFETQPQMPNMVQQQNIAPIPAQMPPVQDFTPASWADAQSTINENVWTQQQSAPASNIPVAPQPMQTLEQQFIPDQSINQASMPGPMRNAQPEPIPCLDECLDDSTIKEESESILQNGYTSSRRKRSDSFF